VFAVVTAAVEFLGPALRSRVVGLRFAVRSVSTLTAARVTVPANPFNGVTVRIVVPVAPGERERAAGVAVTSRSALAEQTVGEVFACTAGPNAPKPNVNVSNVMMAIIGT